MSFLKVNQLRIVKKGKFVYSEVFHNGINIIRGNNSSGKSTISNFIFFILGGEFTSWLPEAASCDFVIAEITLNTIVLTLKREISDQPRRPMFIFSGSIDDALKSNIEGWEIYNYNKSDKVDSFSQILFKGLGFPEVSTDNAESITINQVLRLLYIDQLSALDSLMRNEDFDSPLIRSAIGHLLLGTYDDELLKKQLALRNKEKEFAESKKQAIALKKVFDDSPFEISKVQIQNLINEKQLQLEKILETLREPYQLLETAKPNDSKNQLEELRSNLNKIKIQYTNSKNQIEKDQLSILDSLDFLEVLNSKLISIKESIKSRDFFESYSPQYCPVCLEKIKAKVNDTDCVLCKNPITEKAPDSKLFRMQLELEMQIKESNILLEERKLRIAENQVKIKNISSELKKAQTAYDLFLGQSRTSSENKLDKVIELKGKLIAEIGFLEKQLQLVASYDQFLANMQSLNNQIENLRLEVEALNFSQRKKSNIAYSRIQYYALELLKGDGLYEERFQNGSNVKIDFAKNTFYLDERNRFSASSMVLLKNSIRFAIFFASLELDYFRYPKFILCDNIEDKGMVEARSKNFQNNVIALANSDQFKGKVYQIIMSTSMVAGNLDIPEYTVGDFYNNDNKTLKL